MPLPSSHAPLKFRMGYLSDPAYLGFWKKRAVNKYIVLCFFDRFYHTYINNILLCVFIITAGLS